VNNFNTALSIISGLNSSAVHRLRFTRAEVPERLWAVRSPLCASPHAVENQRSHSSFDNSRRA
jgi:hypothetical protein